MFIGSQSVVIVLQVTVSFECNCYVNVPVAGEYICCLLTDLSVFHSANASLAVFMLVSFSP